MYTDIFVRRDMNKITSPKTKLTTSQQWVEFLSKKTFLANHLHPVFCQDIKQFLVSDGRGGTVKFSFNERTTKIYWFGP